MCKCVIIQEVSKDLVDYKSRFVIFIATDENKIQIIYV